MRSLKIFDELGNRRLFFCRKGFDPLNQFFRSHPDSEYNADKNKHDFTGRFDAARGQLRNIPL